MSGEMSLGAGEASGVADDDGWGFGLWECGAGGFFFEDEGLCEVFSLCFSRLIF